MKRLSTRRDNRKSTGKLDPYRARESRKYQNPIPSREFILTTLEVHGAPLGFDELAKQLEIAGEEQVEALFRRLAAMRRDGQLLCNRRGGYCIVNKHDLIAGRVIGHPDGFGFLHPDTGGDDLFLTPHQMNSLWHGDRVVVRVSGIDHRGRREAALVEVLERGVERLVGRINIESGIGIVVSDNKRHHHEVLIPTDRINGAGHHQMVQVSIDEQPAFKRKPVGTVTEILGDHMAPGMETEVAIRTHGIPVEWPDAVTQAIKTFGRKVPSQAIEGRLDLRGMPLVTIDGEDARDFDDAVYCQATPKGWKLWVCIADVSAYVKTDDALDGEAYLRGNSVYFPDRVVPMLPEVLSNGLCSLNPEVDRLCMAAELYIDRSGNLYRSSFHEAVMRSHSRFTYNHVAAILVDGDAKLCEQHAELLPHLHELYALYQVLHASRTRVGAIDFETTETRFLMDADGKLSGIVPTTRNDAHKIIEECMLVANVAAANFLLRRKIPALYRVHESPAEEKLTDLQQFLGELGLSLTGGMQPTAKDYAELLEKIRFRKDAHMIQTVLLRSMKQAIYSAENLGHFGLAFPAYAHFTSPIRRYPDLMVHRAIKHLVRKQELDEFDYSTSQMVTMGEHCSMTERRADEATRDVADTLKCEYMLDKVGEVFPGVITGVNSFGIFVDLDDIYVTGLVHVTSLKYDYFHFDPVGHRLTGERSGTVYRLGDEIRVKVAAVNLDERKIDFVLEDDKSGSPRDGRKTSKTSRRRSGTKTGGRKQGGPTAKKSAGAGKSGQGSRRRRNPK